MSEQHVVRHYRAPVRAEIEQAYRGDALRAARVGYVPVSQTWSHDERGSLLAVVYARAGAPPAPAGEVEPTADDARDQFSSTGAASVDGFAPPQEPLAEPQADLAGDRYEPVERYAHPPEIYVPPSEMYVPVTPPVAEPAPQEPEPRVPEPQVQPDTAPPLEHEAPPHQPAPSEMEAAALATEELATEREAAVTPAPTAAPPGRQTILTVQTLEMHAGGEPLRIIRSGFPEVPQLPVLERREWIRANADHVRRALMLEPRGHRDMYGAILLPPHSDHADMTVLFMHNDGYSTMCGHGVIAITTGLIEEGLFPATEPVTTIRYEVPAGIVAANAATVRLDDGGWAVRGVRFTNVPSYLAAQSLAVRPDGVELHGTAAQYGALGVDLAFGGAYYGIVNAAELGLRVVPEQAGELRRAGAAITDTLRRDHKPSHPVDAALSFVYGTIIVDLDPRSAPDGRSGDAHIRNATIFAEAELDRSPCGSGTSAILAQLHARGRIRVGQEIINAGITGEHFLGRIEAETQLGPYQAVTTSIAGTAYVTGYSTFTVDDRDPLGEGFLLG
jgi:proline racemase